MKGQRYYTLPTGGTTEDPNAYADAWRKPGEIVARALGMRVGGFDPGYLFFSLDKHGDSAHIPTDAVLRLAKILEEK